MSHRIERVDAARPRPGHRGRASPAWSPPRARRRRAGRSRRRAGADVLDLPTARLRLPTGGRDVRRVRRTTGSSARSTVELPARDNTDRPACAAVVHPEARAPGRRRGPVAEAVRVRRRAGRQPDQHRRVAGHQRRRRCSTARALTPHRDRRDPSARRARDARAPPGTGCTTEGLVARRRLRAVTRRSGARRRATAGATRS